MPSNLAGQLRQVAGGQTLRLTHYGRRSGKPYEVTIWFVAGGDRIYLATGNVTRQWVRNVKKTTRVRLSIGRVLFDGEARFLTDPDERDRVLEMVRRKYWMFLPMIALWRLLALTGFVRYQTGAFEVTLSES